MSVVRELLAVRDIMTRDEWVLEFVPAPAPTKRKK
jgi:hypothetical protein